MSGDVRWKEEKMLSRIKFLFAVSLLVFAGCGGEPSAPNDVGENNGLDETNQNQEANENDEKNEDGKNQGNGEECVPVAECAAEQCGVIDDGCGGTLECDACGCVDGVAQVSECGLCGLGTLTCGSNETGPGACEDVEIPGAGSCEDLIFVDQREGSATGRGTKDDPVTNLAAGVSVAKSSGAVAVIVAGAGSVTYEGPILIDRRVSIIGGFDSNWERNDERPKVVSNASLVGFEDNDIVGISVQDVQQNVLLSDIVIETADAGAEGNNYGLHVYESPGLTLRRVNVLSGDGGEGIDGPNGARGKEGPKGVDATPQWSQVQFEDMLDQMESHRGRGGKNSSCPEANGGDGGRGELLCYPGSPSGACIPATEGEEANSGAQGGQAGAFSDDASVVRGADGQDGEVVLSAGAPNGAGGKAVGEVVDRYWVSLGQGEPGARGSAGKGGGGGGGGGGFAGPGDVWDYGSSGGGGGAGGCGGDGGQGGGAGGSSFGLFVVGGDIKVEDSLFMAGMGGEGGAGGLGGDGGLGGAGGAATELFNGLARPYWFVPEMGYRDPGVNIQGGKGGAGSKGEKGGAGGGGAGGSSFGAYCEGAELIKVGINRFSGAGVSPGGISAGQSGEVGVSADEFQCD